MKQTRKQTSQKEIMSSPLLHNYLSTLLNDHETASSRVTIVVDNALLTAKARMRVTASFLSVGEDLEDRRNSRWSSTPTLRRSNSNPTSRPPYNHRQRHLSLAHAAGDDVGSGSGGGGGKNATWEDFRGQKSNDKLFAGLDGGHVNPPSSGGGSSSNNNSGNRGRKPPSGRGKLGKSNSFTAPKLPERFLSPHGSKSSVSFNSKLDKNSRIGKGRSRKNNESSSSQRSSRHHHHDSQRNSLRDALGPMSPLEGRRSKPEGEDKRRSSGLRRSASSSSSSDSRFALESSLPTKDVLVTTPTRSSTTKIPPTLRNFKLTSSAVEDVASTGRNWNEKAIDIHV